METWEAAFVRQLMAEAGGNLSRAARAAGMSRSHLRALLVRYGQVD